VKILALSDTQLGSGRNLAADRLADQEAVLDQIADLADAEDVDLVVHCGDVFQSRTPSDEARLVFKRFAKRIANGPRDFVVVSGNHDLRNAALASPVDLTDDYYDFVREPRVLQTRAGALACLPWAPPGNYIASRNGSSREQLNAEIAALVIKSAAWLRRGDPYSDYPGPMILAGHWMVSGGSLPNGLPVSMLGGPVLPLPDLEELGFDLCLFGDVHVPERLGLKVISVGSPALNDWGEENIKHGVWIIETEEGLDTASRFVPLDDRRFQTVDVDLTKALPEEGGVNQSSSDSNGQEMSPLRSPRDSSLERTSVSTSPPAGSAFDESDAIAAALATHFPLTDATVRLRVKAIADQIRCVDFTAIRKLAEDAGVHRLIVAPPDIERVERARVAGVDETLSVPAALDLWVQSQSLAWPRGQSPIEPLRMLTAELLEEVQA
jgi:exonuclease SbcD